MARIVCSKCGKAGYWHGGRGMKLADARSQCCGVEPAKGHMINIQRNNLREEWLTETVKLHVVNSKLISRDGDALPTKIEAGEVWFSIWRASDQFFLPAYIPANYIEYYRLPLSVVEKLGIKLQEEAA